MQKHTHWKIYSADNLTLVSIWVRRNILRHKFVLGRDLKSLLTRTNHKDQRKYIHNKKIYGVRTKKIK